MGEIAPVHSACLRKHAGRRGSGPKYFDRVDGGLGRVSTLLMIVAENLPRLRSTPMDRDALQESQGCLRNSLWESGRRSVISMRPARESATCGRVMTDPLLLVIRLHVAAVDQYVLAGDIARVFRTEVTAQAGNFLDAAKASHRNPRNQIFHKLRV
jgi:hypothetical protein